MHLVECIYIYILSLVILCCSQCVFRFAAGSHTAETSLYQTQRLFTRRIPLSVLCKSFPYSRLVVGSRRTSLSRWSPYVVRIFVLKKNVD
jgi:hypothetical protein